MSMSEWAENEVRIACKREILTEKKVNLTMAAGAMRVPSKHTSRSAKTDTAECLSVLQETSLSVC